MWCTACVHVQWYIVKLKTLFNIAEAPFKNLLSFEVCVVWWCSDGPITIQEYNSFEIYAVSIKISTRLNISPQNERSGRPFILTQQSMGRNEYGISGRLHIFAFLKHLMVLLRCNSFRASFLHLSKTLIVCRDMQLRFVKSENIVYNAFNNTWREACTQKTNSSHGPLQGHSPRSNCLDNHPFSSLVMETIHSYLTDYQIRLIHAVCTFFL